MKSVSMNFGTMWKMSCKILATLQRLRFLQVYKKLKILSVLLLLVLQRQRGFSKMNIIYSDKRSCLTVENIANLTIINLIGLPLSSWEPIASVKKWLRRNHSADDNRVKKKTDKEIDDN